MIDNFQIDVVPSQVCSNAGGNYHFPHNIPIILHSAYFDNFLAKNFQMRIKASKI